MEINIKVTIELPEWAEKLAQQIVNNAEVKPVTSAKPAEKPATEEKPVDEKPADEKPAKPAKPKLGLGKTKPAEKPAAEEKPADEAPACTHTLEELREIMPTKFEGNAATIKAKLGEFNTVSLSKLDPKYYDEMYDFLMSL